MDSRSHIDSPTMLHSPHSRHTMPGYSTASRQTQIPDTSTIPALGVKLITGSSPAASELAKTVDLKFPPELSEVGTSGVYFLRDSRGERCAVFKPIDEEYGAVRNPRSETVGDQDQMKGFEPGHGFLKEYAAFNVSKSMFGNQQSPHILREGSHLDETIVPETCVVMIPWGFQNDTSLGSSRFKIGSLQQYIPGEDATDFGSAMFTTANVQQIALLDLRILNCDRNFGNMLVDQIVTGDGKRNLKAIDHAFSFPCAFTQLEQVSFDWLMWPQVKEPIVPELREVIANIDVNEDMSMLSDRLHVSNNSILAFWMATKLLQEGAEAGLTLYDIGSMCQRTGDRSQPSTLEEIFVSTLEALTASKYENTVGSLEDENNTSYDYGDAFEQEFSFQCRIAMSTLASRNQT